MKYTTITALTVILSFASAQAVMLTTEFNTSDGFITGDLAAATLGGLVTFSGGQQQQMFDGRAYNNNPAGYLFINAPGGFAGNTGIAASTGDTGLINIGGQGATQVSFHAANLEQGAGTVFTSIGTDGSVLETFTATIGTLAGTDPSEILSFSAVNGVNIASITVDLPGPAANAPYVASIDTFSATVAIPEPSASILAGLALGLSFLRRRR